MNKSACRFVWILLLLLIMPCLTGCTTQLDRFINDVSIDPPYSVKPATAELHKRLTIIDLHSDPLLWNRNILERNSYGHVDLPRLRDGNMAIQVFGVVTGVPFPLSMEGNSDKRDLITLLAKLGDWPENTHHSRTQRALYQAKKLKNSIAASKGQLLLIENQRDLKALLAARNQGEQVIGAMLSLEGAHALEGELHHLELLFKGGFRILGLVHLMDNDMAGSTHGKEMHGLTEKGRNLIKQALRSGIIIDLAHASTKTINDVVTMVDRPVIASHGGVRVTCDSIRNLTDDNIKAIADTGGIIGIGLYKYATCGKTMADTVKAIRHVVDLVGVEHVAIGSDFDGAVETVTDVTGMPLLTETLLMEGYSQEDIEAIMGGNAIRVFSETLPP